MNAEPMTAEEIAVFDVENIAIHEAAHAVVAARFAKNRVLVSLYENSIPEANERTVLGNVRYTPNKSKLQISAIGWAGVLGEEMRQAAEDRNGDTEIILGDFVALFDRDASPSDMASIESVCSRFQPRAARMAYDILRENWGEVLELARALRSGYLDSPTEAFSMVWKKGRGWGLPESGQDYA